MSVYMVVNDIPADLTTATGWGCVIEWAEGLDPERYGELIHLAQDGESSDLPLLAAQLGDAIANRPPRRAGTKTVVRMLYNAIKDETHVDQGYVIISDGMNDDPDEDPDDTEADEDYGDVNVDSIDADGATFGRYTIRLVNPKQIRKKSLGDEEFAIHADLPDLVPPEEIWVSNAQPPAEQVYLISTALFEIRGLKEGLLQSDAYQRAVAYQKTLRNRHAAVESLSKGAMTAGRRLRRPSMYKQKLGVTLSPNLTVWLVNEPLARQKFETDFVEGGNPHVYSWIPAGEIWVSSNVAETERNYVALREFVEQYLLSDHGLDYLTSHYIASRVEFRWRHSGRRPRISQFSGQFVDDQLDALGGVAETEAESVTENQ